MEGGALRFASLQDEAYLLTGAFSTPSP
jgi:hypothetical protein